MKNKNSTNRIEEIDTIISSFNEQVKALKKEKQKILKEVEGKPKANFTRNLVSILKKYNFYKVDSKWEKDDIYIGGEFTKLKENEFALTIGVQPEGKWNKDFDDKAAANNYEKIVEEISSLDLVKKAEKGSYYVGMGGKMAGLQIVVDKKKLLEIK